MSSSNRDVPFLRRQTSALPLSLFRILWGAALLWEIFRYWGRLHALYIEPPFYFSYDFFRWVRPWAGDGIYIHFSIMALAALGVMLGVAYRLSSVVLFLTFSSFFLMEKAKYLNHFYFISLLAFLMIFVEADRMLSLSQAARRRRTNLGETIPLWQISLLQFQVIVVYFYGGIAKLNFDWLSGEPMRHWLGNRAHQAGLLEPLFRSEFGVYFFSYGGLLYDLLIGFMLLSRRFRLLAVLLCLFFHLMNAWVFTIGIFPWLMIATLVLFLDAETLTAFLPFRSKGYQAASPQPCEPPGRLLITLGTFYIAVQLLLPFRHWIFPGNVVWTEEGHRFSWRMKLRDKSGIARVITVNPKTGETTLIHPRRYLTHRQYRKMRTRPDMLLEFGQYVLLIERERGNVNPEIYLLCKVSVNGRPFQWIVDPARDYSGIWPNPLGHDPWIMPLQHPTARGEYPEKPSEYQLLLEAQNAGVPVSDQMLAAARR